MNKRYDIFISYRRKTGADDARLLQQALKARGFNVFFDYDSLRAGQFDKRIYTAIEEAPFFILMLSEGALDNCVNEGDWVRNEIEYALKLTRKIIPVAVNPSAWTFPECLPAKIMEGIGNESISELNKAALFEESIEKLIKDRLSLFMHNKCYGIRKFSIVFGVFIGLVLCCCLLMYKYFAQDLDLDSVELWPIKINDFNDKRKLRLGISKLVMLEEEERALQNIETQIDGVIMGCEEKLRVIDRQGDVEIKRSEPIFKLYSEE